MITLHIFKNKVRLFFVLLSTFLFSFVLIFFFFFEPFVYETLVIHLFFIRKMTQKSVIGFNSLAFGKLLIDDLYNNINQTDNSTVYITPRYNTTGKTELKVWDNLKTRLFNSSNKSLFFPLFTVDWCIITFYTKK